MSLSFESLPFLFFPPPPSIFQDSIYRGRGSVTDPAPSHLCTCMERAVPLVCHGTGRGGHWRRRLRDTTSLSSHHEEVRVASEEEEGETVPSKNGTVLYIYIYIGKCMKRRRCLQNMPFHLNGNRRQSVLVFKSVLQLVRFCSLVLGFGFLQSSL